MIDSQNDGNNWFLSAKQSRDQRDGSEAKNGDPKKWETPEEFAKLEEAERAKWRARKALDPGNIYATSGMWQYSKDKHERRWVTRNAQSPGFNLARETSHLSLGEPVGETFFTNEGDSEISCIYRELWVGGDKKAFLDTIYQYACRPYVSEGNLTDNVARTYADHNGTIPEKNLWEIFRCLVSELVPEEKKWDGIPPHIVDEPDTIWQVGKCMLHIITRGRFWDDDFNTLNPVDNGEKFGHYKAKVLQAKYSKTLVKNILNCLACKQEARPTRQILLDHFEKVFSVYDGTYIPEPVDNTADLPYEPENRNPLIPTGLTNAEGAVYERLLKIVENRQKQGGDDQKTPHIVTITDLAKDYDDLTAMLCLKELHRLGVVTLKGFVANLIPAEKRAIFGRGALDSLGLEKIIIGKGSRGDAKNDRQVLPHEFSGTEAFMAPPEKYAEVLPKILDGQKFLTKLFNDAIDENRKLTFLGISSLMDIAIFAKNRPDLLQKGLANVSLQGGYRMVNGRLTADSNAANNAFDMVSAQFFHDFIQKNQIPSTVWTKVVAFAVPIYTTVFEFMEATGHPLGPYLRKVQVAQDVSFYESACSKRPFQWYMTQDWYVMNRSAWFLAGHECDEPYPEGKEMIPYFIKVVAYDALAALGAAGQDVIDEFKLIKPLTTRKDAAHPIHTVVGVAEVEGNPEIKQKPLPADVNMDVDAMGTIVTALLKGALLSCQQGLKAEL
jgi:hypothetical protein